MAFFGDALAHAILPEWQWFTWWRRGASHSFGVRCWRCLSSIGIGRSATTKLAGRRGHRHRFFGMFALGIALISSCATTRRPGTLPVWDVLAFLTATCLNRFSGALILLAIVLFYKEFLVLSFDPLLAATLRLPDRLLEYLLLILIALAIVVSLQTVGWR